jgi:hypothetical protein
MTSRLELYLLMNLALGLSATQTKANIWFICNPNKSKYPISNCHPERLVSGAKDLAPSTLQSTCIDHYPPKNFVLFVKPLCPLCAQVRGLRLTRGYAAARSTGFGETSSGGGREANEDIFAGACCTNLSRGRTTPQP